MKRIFQPNRWEDAERFFAKFGINLQTRRLLCVTSHIPEAPGDGGDLFGLGEIVAAMQFTLPVARWSERVCELHDVVMAPGKETQMRDMMDYAEGILSAMGEDLIIAYADNEMAHGWIYRVCGFVEEPSLKRRIDGYEVIGKKKIFIHGRTLNERYGTQSPRRVQEKIKADYPGMKVVPHYDSGKKRLWKAISDEGMQKAERLKLFGASKESLKIT